MVAVWTFLAFSSLAINKESLDLGLWNLAWGYNVNVPIHYILKTVNQQLEVGQWSENFRLCPIYLSYTESVSK